MTNYISVQILAQHTFTEGRISQIQTPHITQEYQYISQTMELLHMKLLGLLCHFL